MDSTLAPAKIQLPWAQSGTRTNIPVASQIGVTPGAASFTDGFPPLTRTPLSSGGVPPSGADMNGALYSITDIQQWQSAGGLFKYDSAFATAIGGYPKGAILINSASTGFWLNQVENNTTNPDTGGSGWRPFSEIVSLKRFGAVGNNAALDTAAFAAALTYFGLVGGGSLYIPAGTFLINAQQSIPDSTPIIVFGDGSTSVLKKAFNGDVISLGKRSKLSNLQIDGDGLNFTGRGVVISTGSVDLSSWRRIDNCEIINTASYPVEYTTAVAGYGSIISECTLTSTVATVPGVKYPTSELNGNRQLLNTYTSGPICDTAGCNNLLVQGCEGAAPLMSPNNVKVRLLGNRIPDSPSAHTFTMDGTDTICSGNILGVPNITFASTLSNGQWVGNGDSGAGATVTDNANGTNRLELYRKLYTPTWTATGGSPAIGNGSLGGACVRRGQMAEVAISLVIGSTSTTTGTDWTLTVPYTAARTQSGSVFIQQNGGGLKRYAGSCYIAAGTNTLQFVAAGSTNQVGTTTPAAWTTNDTMLIDIEFLIQ